LPPQGRHTRERKHCDGPWTARHPAALMRSLEAKVPPWPTKTKRPRSFPRGPSLSAVRPNSVMRVLDHGERFELVERRRARQGPFQRRRALAPVVAGGLLAGSEGVEDVDEEDQDRDGHDLVAERRHPVPVLEGRRIVRIAARHALEAEEVH